MATELVFLRFNDDGGLVEFWAKAKAKDFQKKV
jgi:hypothetical protein